MANINKYWILLESLHLPIIEAPKNASLSEEQRVKVNLNILRDCIKLSAEDIVKRLCKIKCLEYHVYEKKVIGNADDRFMYGLYSFEMLLAILENANFSSDATEDLVSEKHKSLIISNIFDVASFTLQENLHHSFYKGKGALFKKNSPCETNFYRLDFIVEIFSSLIHIRGLHIGHFLDDVHLWYMASIFSLIIAFNSENYNLNQSNMCNLQAKLQKMWLELSKKLYYRNLMLLYSSLPNVHKQRIHREMLLRLWSSGGFVALLFAVAESQRYEGQPVDQIIADLVAQPNYSIKAQHSMIKQVIQFLKASLKNTDYFTLMGPALLSFRKLHDNKSENKEFVKKLLEREIEPLIKTNISEMVAMEWLNFTDLIALLYHLFCTSSIASLPSEMLTPYLPIILELYSQLEYHTGQNTVKNHLHSLSLRILNDQTKTDLKRTVECVTFKLYPKEWFHLSSNIKIKENPLNIQELRLSLAENQSFSNNKHSLETLVAILKRSSHNLLAFQHFIILLQLVPSLVIGKNSSTLSNSNIDLLESEEDIFNKVLLDFSQVYEHKIGIVKALESLVQHKPFKAIINDNIKEILKVLQDIFIVYTGTIHSDDSETEINSAILTVLLILMREIIENCSIEITELRKNLIRPLKLLESQTQSENIKFQVNCVLRHIDVIETYGNPSCAFSGNEFEEARTLTESNKSYLQVEGIEKIIKLINRRDAFTMANSHILMALALNTLKSTESYTFLNCVRLFVTLVNVNETGVLHILSDEYTNEAADMDYRLVIGEALLKISSELGPLCYKYKDVLLNTYITGCHSPLNEFRFSAFSNLSHMCRQLTYQVHNYFQELMNLIDCELTTGKYLPAKRAAVMVLSDLLNGMDNLLDYEEMLLPIYRLLKHLAALENNDEKIRIHALNGLRSLSEKCKDLYRSGMEQQRKGNTLKKEIKIMGIGDKPIGNFKSHILEIN